MKKLSPAQIENLIMRDLYLQNKLLGVKEIYAERDEIAMALRGQRLPKTLSLNGAEYSVELADNFAEKNIVFRPASVRRFELHVEPVAPKTPKKRGKK